jgi:hypothetical protein
MGACSPATGSSRACLPMRRAARSGRLPATRRPATDTGAVLATTPAAARLRRSSEAERESRVSGVTGTLALDRDSLNPEIYLSSPGGRQPNQRRADCSGKPFKPGLFFCYKFRRRLHSDTTRRRDERERDKPWIIPHWWHPALFQAQGTRSPDRHGIMSFPFFQREGFLSYILTT